MEDNIHPFLLFNDAINKLKLLERTGWKLSGIKHAESVAEHTFHVSSIVIYLSSICSQDIDYKKLLVLSVIHDMSEAVYGDIPTPDKTDEDRERERKWVINALEALGYPPEWGEELDKHSSPEAILVKMADSIATVFQGLSYLEKGFHEHLIEIIENNMNILKSLYKSLGDKSLEDVIDSTLKMAEEKIRRFREP